MGNQPYNAKVQTFFSSLAQYIHTFYLEQTNNKDRRVLAGHAAVGDDGRKAALFRSQAHLGLTSSRRTKAIITLSSNNNFLQK